jgi:hypothetical protein
MKTDKVYVGFEVLAAVVMFLQVPFLYEYIHIKKEVSLPHPVSSEIWRRPDAISQKTSTFMYVQNIFFRLASTLSSHLLQAGFLLG